LSSSTSVSGKIIIGEGALLLPLFVLIEWREEAASMEEEEPDCSVPDEARPGQTHLLKGAAH